MPPGRMNESSGSSARVHRVDLGFEPLHLRGDDAQRSSAALAALGRAQIGAEIEQIVLDARQHRVGLGIGMEPRQADRGVGLVDRAERLDPQRLLRHAAAVAERGLSLVAAARVDAGELDHRQQSAASHLAAIIIRIAKHHQRHRLHDDAHLHHLVRAARVAALDHGRRRRPRARSARRPSPGRG